MRPKNAKQAKLKRSVGEAAEIKSLEAQITEVHPPSPPLNTHTLTHNWILEVAGWGRGGGVLRSTTTPSPNERPCDRREIHDTLFQN
jgi:hypothetical protein